MTEPHASVTPVAPADRVAAVDVLRGFVVLGILVMNVQLFGLPHVAYFNPTAFGNFTGDDYTAWAASELLVNLKFMAIFSMLFGAGVVMMTSRIEGRGGEAFGVYHRRMLWLIAFGLVHGYLLWLGDILFLYGVCGLALYWFRKGAPRTLFVTGVTLLAGGASIMCLFGWYVSQQSPDWIDGLMGVIWLPPASSIWHEIRVYQSSDYFSQIAFRAPEVFEFQTTTLTFWGLWRAGGLMLMGMALYKWGVLSAVRSKRFYLALAFGGFALGLPIVARGIVGYHANDWSGVYSFFFGGSYNYVGSVFVAFGWIGVIMCIAKTRWLRLITLPLAAVGRMALSNYIGQTLICVAFFCGWGYSKFSTLDRAELLLVVLWVWVFQLIASPLWLSRFRSGPLEWLWRSLSYRERQPFLL